MIKKTFTTLGVALLLTTPVYAQNITLNIDTFASGDI